MSTNIISVKKLTKTSPNVTGKDINSDCENAEKKADNADKKSRELNLRFRHIYGFGVELNLRFRHIYGFGVKFGVTVVFSSSLLSFSYRHL